jgi:dethiobiotin synthetase
VRGCFVTGTGTGVGKTVLAAAIAAALVSRGERVTAFKPVVTGLDEPEDPAWPPDHELLASVTRADPALVAPVRLGPPVSPHLAAETAGDPIHPERIRAAARAAASSADALVVEGVGGLLVPLARRWSVRDLAGDLGLPLVIAALPGLGTINHTLLTLEAARAAGLDVRLVVLGPWPGKPGRVELSNRATIAELGAVEVATLPRLARAERDGLAAAGAALPLERLVAGKGR